MLGDSGASRKRKKHIPLPHPDTCWTEAGRQVGSPSDRARPASLEQLPQRGREAEEPGRPRRADAEPRGAGPPCSVRTLLVIRPGAPFFFGHM